MRHKISHRKMMLDGFLFAISAYGNLIGRYELNFTSFCEESHDIKARQFVIKTCFYLACDLFLHWAKKKLDIPLWLCFDGIWIDRINYDTFPTFLDVDCRITIPGAIDMRWPLNWTFIVFRYFNFFTVKCKQQKNKLMK